MTLTVSNVQVGLRALGALAPDKAWAIAADGTVNWQDADTPPTQAELDAAAASWAIAELASLKIDAKRRLAARADEIGSLITGPVPSLEKDSWSAKEAAATAHKAGTATALQTSMLQAESNVTGETLTELADKILANPPTYYAAVGSIAGLRRTTCAAIDALTDLDTFEADVKAITDAAEVQAQTLLAQILGS